MKNLLLKSLLVIALASSIVACSKDDSSSSSPTPAATIVGNWNVNKTITFTKLGTSILQNDTTNYITGEFKIEFTNTNKAIVSHDTSKDTSQYVYANNKLLIIDYDPIDGYDTTTFNSVTLTASSLVMANRDTTTTSGGNLISIFEIFMTK